MTPRASRCPSRSAPCRPSGNGGELDLWIVRRPIRTIHSCNHLASLIMQMRTLALFGGLACLGVLIATADPLKHEQLRKGGQTSDCSTIVRNLRAALRIVDRHGLGNEGSRVTGY
jgi:hypothetical protein